MNMSMLAAVALSLVNVRSNSEVLDVCQINHARTLSLGSTLERYMSLMNCCAFFSFSDKFNSWGILLHT